MQVSKVKMEEEEQEEVNKTIFYWPYLMFAFTWSPHFCFAISWRVVKFGKNIGNICPF